MALNLLLPYPVVVIDTETGGLNPSDEISWKLNKKRVLERGSKVVGKFNKFAAPILEIGAIRLDPQTLEEVSYFHSICGPEVGEDFDDFLAKCTPQALKVNGFGDRLEELRGAPPLSNVLKDLVKWLPGHGNKVSKFLPAGQNVRFDLDMINLAAERHNVDLEIRTPPLELISYSMLYFALPETEIVANYKLTTVSSALGINIDYAHTALFDTRMTAQCMRIMFKKLTNS